MRRVEMEGAVRRVRDIRLALAALLVLSMTANLALTVGLAGRETVTVLVPAVTGPAWAVGGSAMQGRAGARYLEDMARTVAVTLLTLTPENAGHVRGLRRRAWRMPPRAARSAPGSRPRPPGWPAATWRAPSTPTRSKPPRRGWRSRSRASS